MCSLPCPCACVGMPWGAAGSEPPMRAQLRACIDAPVCEVCGPCLAQAICQDVLPCPAWWHNAMFRGARVLLVRGNVTLAPGVFNGLNVSTLSIDNVTTLTSLSAALFKGLDAKQIQITTNPNLRVIQEGTFNGVGSLMGLTFAGHPLLVAFNLSGVLSRLQYLGFSNCQATSTAAHTTVWWRRRPCERSPASLL